MIIEGPHGPVREGTDHNTLFALSFANRTEFKAWSARPPPFHPRADLTDPPGQSPFGWVVLFWEGVIPGRAGGASPESITTTLSAGAKSRVLWL